MIVTVDTNVVFAALYSDKGASHTILRLILDEKLELVISTPTFFEYYDVLTRAENLIKLSLSISDVEDILDLLVLVAKKHSIYYLLRPNLLDEDDNIFMECAFVSRSDFLITSNIKDFISGELKDFYFRMITPGDFLNLWESSHE